MSAETPNERVTESYVSGHTNVRHLSKFIRYLKIASGTFMALLLLVTVVDVVGRYAFNKPVPGGFEIIEFILGLLIFTAFPVISFERSHITVSLFDSFMSKTIMRLRDGAVLLGSIGVVLMISWLMFLSGVDMYQSGYVSRYMDFPMAPVVFLIAALGGMTSLILISMTWFHFKMDQKSV